MRTINNAVLVPLEPGGRILVQDRRGHKPPPWGYFGGVIELGETPLEAVVREVWEELTFKLPSHELTPLESVSGQTESFAFTFHAFLWPFDGTLTQFIQREGAAMELVTPDEMLGRTEPDGPDYALTLLLKNKLTKSL